MNESNVEGEMNKRASKTVITCICPNCGYEKEQKKDKPCYEASCPECGTLMKKL